ncbi:hypothetical protein PMAYCL1PPCAC_00754, partial [Pristionchus mayeri]
TFILQYTSISPIDMMFYSCLFSIACTLAMCIPFSCFQPEEEVDDTASNCPPMEEIDSDTKVTMLCPEPENDESACPQMQTIDDNTKVPLFDCGGYGSFAPPPIGN